MDAVGSGERREHVLGADGTSEYRGACEPLDRGLETEAEAGEGRDRVGEERPGRGGGLCGGTGSGVEEVDEGGGVRGLAPLREEAVEEESGLADAAGAVKEQRLRHARVEGMVVEDGLEDGPRDHAPRAAACPAGGGSHG